MLPSAGLRQIVHAKQPTDCETQIRIWQLVPIDPGQPHWEMSTYRGLDLVRAEDENRARDTAAMAFASAVNLRARRDTIYLPWRHAEFVACYENEDPAHSTEGEEEILVPVIPAFVYRPSVA